MLYENQLTFTKSNLDICLKELGKEFRKANGKTMPAEIVLIGGAAILANYGFRDMTSDVDAIIRASSAMKDAINTVGDKLGLPKGWLNADFMHTSSYSPRLLEVSTYYKTFSNVLEVRTVSAEYLVAMKLHSGRKYKNDMSDIIGILSEHDTCGDALTMQRIEQAVETLYGGWDGFPKESKQFITDVLKGGDYLGRYASIKSDEKISKEVLTQFDNENPNTLKEENINTVLKMLREKQQ